MSDNQSMNLRGNIYLIGKTISSLNNKKLPANKEVLKFLYHHSRNLKKSIDDSCASVIREVIGIWSGAAIPTQINSRCILKLKNLYTEYRNTQKYANRHKKSKEEDFLNKLEQLFDIAHGNVFELIDEETKQFLIDQRFQRIFHLNITTTVNESTNETGNLNEN